MAVTSGASAVSCGWARGEFSQTVTIDMLVSWIGLGAGRRWSDGRYRVVLRNHITLNVIFQPPGNAHDRDADLCGWAQGEPIRSETCLALARRACAIGPPNSTSMTPAGPMTVMTPAIA